MIRLMMIVNQPEIARYVAERGVDRIFVDLESLGKQERQGHLDTWMSAHTFDDISRVRDAIGERELLVRLNPWHPGSPAEIDQALARGADLLMLPMFRRTDELAAFCAAVADRAPVIPLVETAEAFACLDAVAAVPGVSEVFIGLNDLHLSCGLKFMFQPLANGMLDQAAEILHRRGTPFGFGGIARVGEGLLPAERILGEHVRLGSSSVILSRTFHRKAPDLDSMCREMDFAREVSRLREAFAHFQAADPGTLEANRREVQRLVAQIAGAH